MIIRTLLGLTVLLIGGPALAVDLLDIYHQARINDARYAAAKAQYRAMQERVPQARAASRPNLHSGVARYDDASGLQLNSPSVRSGRRNRSGYDAGSNMLRSP